jgi:hypothetical protein
MKMATKKKDKGKGKKPKKSMNPVVSKGKKK